MDFEAKAKLEAIKVELDEIRKAEFEYVNAKRHSVPMEVAHIARLQQMERIVVELAALTRRKPE